MAQPVTLPATLDDDGFEIPDEVETELIASALKDELLNDFLPTYISEVAEPYPVDALGERFKIQISRPLPEYNTTQAKAYAASDTENANRKLYALVCENRLPVRRECAGVLKRNHHVNLIALVAEGITRISNPAEERYILIYEQPKGRRLSDLLAEQTGRLPEKFVIQKILIPLSAALGHMEELGYTHGRVNPDNIYFGEHVILGECCSEPVGLGQDFHYEPITRLQADPTGKGKGSSADDFYALGVLTCSLRYNPKALQLQDQTAFKQHLLQEGPYISFLGYRDLTENMTDFLRGVFNDSVHDRWSYKQVEGWAAGKRFHLLQPSISGTSQRAFDIAGQRYGNLRSLSDGMQKHWQQVIEPIRDGSLGRWVELSARRRDISVVLGQVLKTYKQVNLHDSSVESLLVRCMNVLDPLAPLRLQRISAHLDGIGILLTELYHNRDTKSIKALESMVDNSLYSFWSDTQSKLNQKTSIHIRDALSQLDRSRLLLKTKGLGFGTERLLYDLNPQLPCLSPILKGYYVTSIHELLIALDRLAATEMRHKPPIDKHIVAFVASKLFTSKPINFSEYKAYPELMTNPGLIALKLFYPLQAQQLKKPLPGLTAWISAHVVDALANLHSKSLKEEICKNIRQTTTSGKLKPLYAYLMSFDFVGADTAGFRNANLVYHDFGYQIIDLNNEQRRAYQAFRTGSNIAKGIAYMIFASVLYYVWADF